MRAVILAGGMGTRLHPFTIVMPKPLVPLGNRPVLEIVLRQLAAAGFTRATLAVNHLAELIRAFFGDGGKVGLEIDYSIEDEPLGTIGPLKLLERDLPESFMVMNGDLLTDVDYADLMSFHAGHDAPLTVATHRREVRIDFGVMRVGDGGEIAGFEEKPTESFEVSMGVYAMDRGLLERVPAGRPFGFDDLMGMAIEEGVPVRAFPYDGFWLDIGRPDDYRRAQEIVAEDPDRFGA